MVGRVVEERQDDRLHEAVRQLLRHLENQLCQVGRVRLHSTRTRTIFAGYLCIVFTNLQVVEQVLVGVESLATLFAERFDAEVVCAAVTSARLAVFLQGFVMRHDVLQHTRTIR